MNIECLRQPSASNPSTLYRIRWLSKDVVAKHKAPYQTDLRTPGTFILQSLSTDPTNQRGVNDPSETYKPALFEDQLILQVGLSSSPLPASCTAVLLIDASEFLHLPIVLPRNVEEKSVSFVATHAAFELGLLLLQEYAEEQEHSGNGYGSGEELVDMVKKWTRRCAYGEHVEVEGSGTVAWAIPSGYSTGGALWCFGRLNECVPFLVHLGRSCGNTTLHPKPLDVNLLTRAGLLAFADLPTQFPSSSAREFVTLCSGLLKHKGNILVPCHTFSSLALELIDATFQHLQQSKRFNVTIVIASPQFTTAVAKVKRYVDWLSDAKHEKIVAGSECFSFLQDLKASNPRKRVRVVITHSLSNRGLIEDPLKPPLIVFAGHPDVSFGEGRRLVEFWVDQHNNSNLAKSSTAVGIESHIVLVDATVDPTSALESLNKLRGSESGRSAFTVHKCPLNFHISREEYNALKKSCPCVDLGSASGADSQLRGKCLVHIRSWPNRVIKYIVKRCPEVHTARVVSGRSAQLFIRTEGSEKTVTKLCKVVFDLGDNGTIRLLCDDDGLRSKFMQLIEGK